jgi:hypothetical protein
MRRALCLPERLGRGRAGAHSSTLAPPAPQNARSHREQCRRGGTATHAGVRRSCAGRGRPDAPSRGRARGSCRRAARHTHAHAGTHGRRDRPGRARRARRRARGRAPATATRGRGDAARSPLHGPARLPLRGRRGRRRRRSRGPPARTRTSGVAARRGVGGVRVADHIARAQAGQPPRLGQRANDEDTVQVRRDQ